MTFFMTKWARKDLDRSPRTVKKRVLEALRELRDQKKGDIDVLEDDIWRLRVGDYRAFYGETEEDVWVLKVIHRKKGYAPELIDTLIKRLEIIKRDEDQMGER